MPNLSMRATWHNVSGRKSTRADLANDISPMTPESPWATVFDTPTVSDSITKLFDAWWSNIYKTAFACLIRARDERTVSNFTDAEKFACAAVARVPFDFSFLDENDKSTFTLRYPVTVYALDGQIVVAYLSDDKVVRSRFRAL